MYAILGNPVTLQSKYLPNVFFRPDPSHLPSTLMVNGYSSIPCNF